MSVPERFPDSRNRSEPHICGVKAPRCETFDFQVGIQSEFFGLFATHHQDRCGGIVDPRCISSGDGTVLFEGGPQFCHFLYGRVHGAFVGVEKDFALSRFDHYRHDLLFENPLVDGPFCTLVAQNTQFVLFRPSDIVHFRNIFSRQSHMISVENFV